MDTDTISPTTDDITTPTPPNQPVTLPKRIGPTGLQHLSPEQRVAYFKEKLDSLTEQQLHIAGLLAVGYTTQDIAKTLDTTEESIRAQLSQGDLYGFRGLTPAQQQSLSDAQWRAAERAALAVAAPKRQDVGYMQLITSAAIASDKVHRNYVRQELAGDGEVTEVELRIRKRISTPKSAIPDA